MQKKVFISIADVKRKLERYCVYQDRCHKEVEQKIYEYQLIPEVKSEVLIHLMEHGFLNEERFAKSFARGKFRIKNWGRLRIVRELKFRDISVYNIKMALKEIDDKDYNNTLYSLVEKRNESLNSLDVHKRKSKIINYLNYRGYEFDLIFKVVNELVC